VPKRGNVHISISGAARVEKLIENY
jgi:hypothetical protein